MTSSGDLLIRNVEIGNERGLNVHVVQGQIAEIGHPLRASAPVLEGRGGALIPGLYDHHIHLLALAANEASIHVGPGKIAGWLQFERELRAASWREPLGAFLRATGYHDSVAGPLDRDLLDRVEIPNPIRVQYGTGSLWVLNSAALDAIVPAGEPPPCVETDSKGRPTGRIWRGDAWLRERLAVGAISLATVGARLAEAGVTGVTDASVTTGQREASLLAEATRSGVLPQRLTLMSGGMLTAPADGTYEVGPVKILLDEYALSDFSRMLATVAEARRWGRRVAVHCVTLAELAFTLAAFEQAGVVAGDRIEHGALISDAAIGAIADLGLIVVTQPSFIFERGDTYLAEIDSRDHGSLYRCGALLGAGIRVAGSTDSPYAAPDPWAGIAAAIERRTRGGDIIGGREKIGALAALRLFLGRANDPGGTARRVAAGEPADLCLLHLPLDAALRAPSRSNVAATIIKGCVVRRKDPETGGGFESRSKNV